MANILSSLSRVRKSDVVLSVRDIKKTFIEGASRYIFCAAVVLIYIVAKLSRWLVNQAVVNLHCCNVLDCWINQRVAVFCWMALPHRAWTKMRVRLHVVRKLDLFISGIICCLILLHWKILCCQCWQMVWTKILRTRVQ